MTKKTPPHKKTIIANHFRSLTPEERVNTTIEMTDAVGTIALESIRDQYQGTSERTLLQTARRRLQSGRQVQRNPNP